VFRLILSRAGGAINIMYGSDTINVLTILFHRMHNFEYFVHAFIIDAITEGAYQGPKIDC
jgi:hypothetical protein